MHTLSLVQALSLWSDLESCYHNTHSYGGDEAEIYLYRLMASRPGIQQRLDDPGFFGDLAREAYDDANNALYNLLNHFEKMREVSILVEGRPLGPWLSTARFLHRVHIKVVHKEK